MLGLEVQMLGLQVGQMIQQGHLLQSRIPVALMMGHQSQSAGLQEAAWRGLEEVEVAVCSDPLRCP